MLKNWHFGQILAFFAKILKIDIVAKIGIFAKIGVFAKICVFAKIGVFAKISVFATIGILQNLIFMVVISFLQKSYSNGKIMKIGNFFAESDFCGCDNRKSFLQKLYGSRKVCKNRRKVFIRIQFLGEGQGNFAKIQLDYFKNHDFRCEIQFLQKKNCKHFCNARRYIPMGYILILYIAKIVFFDHTITAHQFCCCGCCGSR
jgi:hypothetical protein